MSQNSLSLNESAQLLKIGRTRVWRKIRSADIQAEKVGRTYIIPAAQFQKTIR